VCHACLEEGVGTVNRLNTPRCPTVAGCRPASPAAGSASPPAWSRRRRRGSLDLRWPLHALSQVPPPVSGRTEHSSLLPAARARAGGGAGPAPASAQPACCHTQAAPRSCFNARRSARWYLANDGASTPRRCAKHAAQQRVASRELWCAAGRRRGGWPAARQRPASKTGRARGGAGAR